MIKRSSHTSSHSSRFGSILAETSYISIDLQRFALSSINMFHFFSFTHEFFTSLLCFMLFWWYLAMWERFLSFPPDCSIVTMAWNCFIIRASNAAGSFGIVRFSSSLSSSSSSSCRNAFWCHGRSGIFPLVSFRPNWWRTKLMEDQIYGRTKLMKDQIDGGLNWWRIKLMGGSNWWRTKLMEDQTDAGSTFVLPQVAHV